MSDLEDHAANRHRRTFRDLPEEHLDLGAGPDNATPGPVPGPLTGGSEERYEARHRADSWYLFDRRCAPMNGPIAQVYELGNVQTLVDALNAWEESK